jgi:pyruvate dehydrogenase E1 component alpha subunit
MMTYRFRGHHVGDAATYRTAKELKWWMENRDPINLLGERMIKHGIADRSRLERVDEQVEEEVVEAVEFARNAPLPPAEQVREDVYA